MLSTAQADPTPWLPLPDLDDWVEGEAPAGTERANNYYRARYYDPKIGRFISEDPVSFRGGDPNFYAYVWNNPTGYIDPTGTSGLETAGAGGYQVAKGLLATKALAGAGASGTGTAAAAAGTSAGAAAAAVAGAAVAGIALGTAFDQLVVRPIQEEMQRCAESAEEDCFRRFKNQRDRCFERFPDWESRGLCVKHARVELRLCLGQPPLDDPF